MAPLRFNFFKKNKKETTIEEHYNDFYGFSDDQKKAILVSLFDIANSDEDFHDKETDFINRTSTTLGYSLKYHQIKKSLNNEREQIYDILRGMNDHQKDWYVITVLTMIYADGKIDSDEFGYVENFLLNVGVSRETIEKNMVKTD